MRVERMTNGDEWDKFVDSSRTGLLFHKWDFLTITERHTGFSLLPLGIFKGEELICIFPVFRRSTYGLDVLLSPPPMQAVMPYLGCVMNGTYDTGKQSKKVSLLDTVMDGIRAEFGAIAPNYIEFRFIPGFEDVRQFMWEGYALKVHYTYTLDLKRPLDAIWDDLNSDLRKKLRKLETAGFHLERSRDLGPFHRVVNERFSDPTMNIPMVSRQYFEDLFRAYPDELGLYYLYDGAGELVAAVTTQEYKDRFLYWVGNPKLNKTGGNEYLQWLLIKKAHEEGFSRFENIGANNVNLNQFKTKFNPGLEIFIQASKSDTWGRMAGWAYSTIVNQRWIKRRVMPHID
jgi:hypothetical protein